MFAEVISIGDELTSGQRLDTNSQWLSERLGELGIRVLFHTTVGDELDANVEVFRVAMQRTDAVVATGGLGPTADDLTRQAIAKAFGRELRLDQDVLKHIRQRFSSSGRSMPEQNQVQAMFPAGCHVIPNPHGTAPGIDLTVSRDGRSASRLFALPGVPAEMRELWTATVQPELQQSMFGPMKVICHHRIKCFGVGESHLEAMLPDLVRRGRRPSVGITVHKATITLRITADGQTRDEALAQMEPTMSIIHQKLGKLVFGEEDDELEHAVARLLCERNQTLATAESGTRGLLADWLGTVPNFKKHYRGGLVVADSSTLSAKRRDQSQVAASIDLCSESAARQMAKMARAEFEADYGLAVSDFPDHDDDSGQFHLALASTSGVESVARRFAGHPEMLRERSAKQALDLLRLTLLAK